MAGNRVPPGQQVTTTWPVLHYGSIPRIDIAKWRLRLFGLVAQEAELTWEQFSVLPQTSNHCDIHCVTHWTRFDNRFDGVRFTDLLQLVRVKPEAKYVMFWAQNYSWSTNVPLADCLREDVLLATRHNGQDLTPEHGWPVRVVIPHLYFWKSAKWVEGIEFMAEDRPGFWERNGYHMRGDVFKEQRYTDDP
jgi:DMSO/TMAO reductase YedYZ molybdopterin-dependent catalytic subunit